MRVHPQTGAVVSLSFFLKYILERFRSCVQGPLSHQIHVRLSSRHSESRERGVPVTEHNCY